MKLWAAIILTVLAIWTVFSFVMGEYFDHTWPLRVLMVLLVGALIFGLASFWKAVLS